MESHIIVPKAGSISTEAPEPLLSFPKFQKLPQELQDMIWDLAIPSERIVHFDVIPNFGQAAPVAEFRVHTRMDLANIALACRDSRSAIGRKYQPITFCQELRKPQPITALFSYGSDILYFNSLEFMTRILKWSAMQRTATTLGRIRRAGCSWFWFFTEIYLSEGTGLCSGSHCPCVMLGALKSLEEFVLLEEAPIRMWGSRDLRPLEMLPDEGFEVDEDIRKDLVLLTGINCAVESTRACWKRISATMPCLQPFQNIKLSFRMGTRD